jgi:3-hydroxybutyryl-CoA dehydrogenase
VSAAKQQRVVVLGTGTMAPGIAVAFAAGGFRVAVCGRRQSRVEAALGACAAMARFLEREGLAEPAGRVLGRIEALPSLEAIGTADVVIEAVAESLAAKHAVLASAEASCGPDALLATNTSGLRVTDIARPLRRPERLVAMHFWNPAHLMPIVEIAGGERSSADAIAQARQITNALGKTPIVLRRETLGFLGTRMQQAVVREAIGLVQADAASAADIDLAVRMSFGVRFPVTGPLESTDLAGLDVIAAIHGYLLADLDRSVEPQPALASRVAQGQLGVKSGRGFYDWSVRDAAALATRRDQEIARRLRLIAAEAAEAEAAGRVAGGGG